MNSPAHNKSRAGALALALGIWFLQGPSAMGLDDPAPPGSPKGDGLLHKRKAPSRGTLGYGPPGLHPGFQGFGLGYHPGYGYGGKALGVGAEGGYPFYGGPGYPHPSPCLRRIGGITPFPYFGGPGAPSPGQPNFFEGVGPLAPDNPVVTIADGSPYAGDYGLFTGSIPYPESTFAPFATREAGEAAVESNPSPPPAPSTAESVPGISDTRSLLGLDTEAVVDSGFARGLKVTRVQPSSAAEKGGLRIGDVIRSANGYLTEQPGHLTWVLLNATPDQRLHLNVLAEKDGEAHAVTLQRP